MPRRRLIGLVGRRFGRRGLCTTTADADPRVAILDRALEHVATHGWSTTALGLGAQDLGLAPSSHGMFARGGFDLVEHFVVKCNARLADDLPSRLASIDAEHDNEATRIAEGLKTRLEYLVPVLATWPQAMALGAHPANLAVTARNIGALSDEIVFHAGAAGADSPGLSWYTRRAMVAKVYGTVEVHLTLDRSPDFVRTWRFLERRLDDVLSIESHTKGIQEVSSVAQTVASGVGAIFSGAQSVLSPPDAAQPHGRAANTAASGSGDHTDPEEDPWAAWEAEMDREQTGDGDQTDPDADEAARPVPPGPADALRGTGRGLPRGIVSGFR